MHFESFGDTQGFHGLGQGCALALEGGTPLAGCYNAIRPVGILVYHAIPHLFASDAIEARYITLFLNLAMAALLYGALLALLRSQRGWRHCPPAVRQAAGVVLLLGVLVCTTPFIPVQLSDHQSLAVFLLGYAVLAGRGFDPGCGRAALAGLLAACAVLLKQNYAVASAALVVLWCAGLQGPRPAPRVLAAFLAGFSVVGLQFWMVYAATGIPWLYAPGALDIYAESNRQPVVELTAYVDPAPAAYLSSLDRPVSGFKYFAAKFFHGISAFHWSVYLGQARLDVLPPLLEYDRSDFVRMRLVVVTCFAAVLACLLLRSRSLTLLLWTSLAFTCYAAATAHAEFRHYLFFRIAALLYALVVACELAALWARRRFAPAAEPEPSAQRPAPPTQPVGQATQHQARALPARRDQQAVEHEQL